jgi:hypothetical protein
MSPPIEIIRDAAGAFDGTLPPVPCADAGGATARSASAAVTLAETRVLIKGKKRSFL